MTFQIPRLGLGHTQADIIQMLEYLDDLARM